MLQQRARECDPAPPAYPEPVEGLPMPDTGFPTPDVRYRR
jgi:hypothetical protein